MMVRPLLCALSLGLLCACAPRPAAAPPDQPGPAASSAAAPMTVFDPALLPPADTDETSWTLDSFPGCFSPVGETGREEYLLLPGTALQNTVHVLRGAAEGPSIYIVAGVHGDERAAWIAGDLMEGATLSAGTVYLLSPANPFGAQKDQRTTKDDWDLNRQFPGDPAGVDAAQIAAAIFADIQDKAPDLVLDLHEARPQTGGRDVLANSIICQSVEGIDELVLEILLTSEEGALCSAPITLFSSPPVGSINHTVTTQLQIPTITVESFRAEGLSQRVRNQLELAEFILAYHHMR